jgi:hypothetical protein
MKYIKTYENFGMNKSICDRCSRSTDGVTTMSIFNQDVICKDCKEEEKNHPNYELACELERKAIKNGDFNYPGSPHLF